MMFLCESYNVWSLEIHVLSQHEDFNNDLEQMFGTNYSIILCYFYIKLMAT